MPRNGSGIYSLPSGYLAETGELILADQHNDPLEDIKDDLNAARPVVAGGTGATTASGARSNLSVYSQAESNAAYVKRVTTKTALKALDTALYKSAFLEESGVQKMFVYTLGDFTAKTAGDPSELSYIPADGIAVSIGCWVAVTGTVASVVPVISGGTGSTNAADARTALGLAIGTDVQAYDADLSAIASLAKTDGNFIVGDGSTWVAESGATARTSLGLTIGTDVQAYSANLALWAAASPSGYLTTASAATTYLTSVAAAAAYQPLDTDLTAIAELTTTTFGRAFLALADEAAFKAAVNLEIGVDVQGYDADLSAIASLAKTDGNFIVGNGTTFTAENGATARASLGLVIGTDVQAYSANLDEYAAVNPTTAGLALLDDADAAAQRTTLGLGTAAVAALLDEDDMASNSATAVPSQQSVKAYVDANLGLVIGTDVQAYSANLDEYAAVNPTAAGLALLDDADASAQRTTLGLAIGTDVQAHDADLTAIGALAKTDGNFIVGNGTTWVAESGATARSSMGLAIGVDVQAYDADLSAIAAFSTTGFAVRTASNTWAQRSIAGTSGKITVTNGDGVSGNPTITVGADIAQLTVADQVITGGARVTSLSLGTITSGTVTPDPGDRPLQHYTNNGAHTLAPGTDAGSYLLDITNGASAGAITTSGWTKKVGDAFTTTNGHKFRCSCTIGNAGSLLVVQAMQ